MKTIQYILLGILFAVILSACEKEIEVSVSDNTLLLVVQANLYPGKGPFYVYLSQSVALKNAAKNPAVEHALVIISDNQGTIDTLSEDSAGRYQTHTLEGVIGRVYQIRITTGNKTYMAASTMHSIVPVDSVIIHDSEFGSGKSIDVYYTDPASTANYYRLREFVNGIPKTDIYVDNDEDSNGKSKHYSILTAYQDDDTELQSGDVIRIQLQSIDKGAYDYFRTMGGLSSMSASPANPISNISNGALGYFNAYSYTESTKSY